MAYIQGIQGVGRAQGTLFPVMLEELIPADHVCRVIDAFVERLAMEELGFVRARGGRKRAAGLRSARFAAAVLVWIAVPDPLLAAFGE